MMTTVTKTEVSEEIVTGIALSHDHFCQQNRATLAHFSSCSLSSSESETEAMTETEEDTKMEETDVTIEETKETEEIEGIDTMMTEETEEVADAALVHPPTVVMNEVLSASTVDRVVLAFCVVSYVLVKAPKTMLMKLNRHCFDR